MPDGTLAELRWLSAAALLGGADPKRLDGIVSAFIAMHLDLAAYRRGDNDPRRQRTLNLAQRAYEAHEDGATIPQLMERFGKSRPTIYRLLCLMTLRDSSSVESALQVKSQRVVANGFSKSRRHR